MKQTQNLLWLSCLCLLISCSTAPHSNDDNSNDECIVKVLADTGQTFNERKEIIIQKWNALKPGDGLGALNFIRFLAGLPDDVELNNEYVRLAQYGSELNAAHGKIGHYQSQPAGMSDDFYKIAAQGIGSSNLGMGYNNLSDAVFKGWANDSDRSNIDSLGHRRWILNPPMQYTGFGMSGGFSSMYAFDKSRKDSIDYQAICFPSGSAFPNDFFKGYWAWSISLNPSLYKTPDFKEIIIKVTEKSSGKSWTRSKDEGYFAVNTGGYGVPNCIIFQLSNIDEYKGKYTVEVKGLNDKAGNPVSLVYETTFFPIDKRDISGSNTSSRAKNKDLSLNYAGSFGMYLNGWHQNLFSAGLPLQLGIEFGFGDMALTLLGEGGVGVGSSSFQENILLEWNYGGMSEFYFPHKIIGVGFGYGIADSYLLSNYSKNESTPALFNTTYMRFGLIFRKSSKTTLYAHLYGDGKWGFGLQWTTAWPDNDD